MTGAAIGTTVVLVLALVVPIGLDSATSPGRTVLGLLLGVVVGGLLGLVPGIRELEVTACRSMLGVRSELVVPLRPGLVHRVQDVLWVQVHLLLGLLTAACLTMLLPAATVTALDAMGANPGISLLAIPDSVLGRIALGAAAVVAAAAALLGAWPLGALAASLAPRLLGPTARDRLEVALARVSQDAERTRIARDLHDGIGHALTIVSIQAAAGGRVLDRDPDAARQALARIEDTAREALIDLDDVLADLREERADVVRVAEAADGAGPSRDADAIHMAGSVEAKGFPGSTSAVDTHGRVDPVAPSRLEAVLLDHREAGMDLRTEVVVPAGLPALQHEHLARLVTELLTNAHRHGSDGPVHLRIHGGRDSAGLPAVIVEAANPLAPREEDSAAAPTGGRGLAGSRERLALWGGTLKAGPKDGTWQARALVPILTERPHDDP